MLARQIVCGLPEIDCLVTRPFPEAEQFGGHPIGDSEVVEGVGLSLAEGLEEGGQALPAGLGSSV